MQAGGYESDDLKPESACIYRDEFGIFSVDGYIPRQIGG